ncbi:MAG: ABC transporter substrate-binding protein [Rhodocyclaceae bacterium]|jgi:phospholipid transport system substrate-binding protein|nr:ABC transporter substrate-binding protein [Rhodocyclaceae bacterium]
MKRIIATLALLVAPLIVLANNLAPDALVKEVTHDVLTIVRQDRAIQTGNTQKAVELVEAKVLPHFNFKHMTADAVGRDWRQATPEQQEQLTEAFKSLLVRTYSNALTQYRDQVIDFKPLRAKPEETDVQVRTEVKQAGAKPVQIDYSLEKTANGWKVYDVLVGGVSLVINYRGSFAQEIKTGGIDGLIKSLQAKNRETAGSSAKS